MKRNLSQSQGAKNILNLSRRIGEALIIRDHTGKVLATIRVKDVSRNLVRMAIEAPDEIEVNREELDRKKHPHTENMT